MLTVKARRPAVDVRRPAARKHRRTTNGRTLPVDPLQPTSRALAIGNLGGAFALALGGVAAVAWAGSEVNLPGSLPVGTACALGLLIYSGISVGDAPLRVAAVGVVSALGAVALVVSIGLAGVQYDFYRYYGGDLNRRGELDNAIAAYEQAVRYAPPESHVFGKLEKLRAERERTP